MNSSVDFNTLVSMPPGDFTFALIKPDGYTSRREEILALLSERGINRRHSVRTLDALDVRKLYYEHIGKFFYDRNAQFLMSGPSLCMLLTGKDVQRQWRDELMPLIREHWGRHNNDPDERHLNLVHGSDSPIAALREVALMIF